MEAVPAKPTALALAGLVALAGCGGGERQDPSEAKGVFPVDIVAARFPAAQRLARQVALRVAVRNAGRRAIPDVALTVANRDSPSRTTAFGQAVPARGSGAELADPSRPVWILDRSPRSGDTAYAGTWALGRLAPGRTKTFAFRLTPLRAGTYSLVYRVAAGLNGKAKARLASGKRAEGTFAVTVSRAPSHAVADTRGGG